MSSPHPEKNSKGEKKVSRRSFLDVLIALGGAVWAAGMAAPAAIYLWPARSRGPGENTVKAGLLSELPVGGALFAHSQGRPILVVRIGENEVRAFSAICTHLGCVVQWNRERQEIDCPCHAGRFSKNGEVLGGPPPAPLPQYQAMLVNDEIIVKLG